MATVTQKKLLSDYLPFSNTPYGNALSVHAFLETNASGVFVNSDQTTALSIADKVRIGVLPAGTRLTDALMIVSDLFTASATAKVGFEYVDGVDVAGAAAQDDDYFAAALALSATGRTRANNLAVIPVLLPKDAYLIVTIAGAALNAVGRLDVIVEGQVVGAP